MSEQQQQVFKSIAPMMCPHCSKEIMVALRSLTPLVEWILRPEDLDKAKEKAIEKVKGSKTVSEEDREDILQWLALDTTVFGPTEVEAILSQILVKKDEGEKKE